MGAKEAGHGGGAPVLEYHGREFTAKAKRCAGRRHAGAIYGPETAADAPRPSLAEKRL
jgi:hypothetical protein